MKTGMAWGLALAAALACLAVAPPARAQSGTWSAACATPRASVASGSLARGAQVLCDLGRAYAASRVPSGAEVAALRARVRDATAQLESAPGAGVERRLAGELIGQLAATQAAVSQKAARIGDLMARDNAISLRDAEADLIAAVAVTARYNAVGSDQLLAYLATNAALGFFLDNNFNACLSWSADADARFYRMLNTLGGAAAGPDGRGQLDGIAEYASGLLSLCAVEARVDLRPVFSALALGRARLLSERLQLDALSAGDRSMLNATRARLRESYQAIAAPPRTTAEAVAADARLQTIAGDERRVAELLKGRDLDGADIERTLEASGAMAAVVVSVSEWGGAVIGVRAKAGGNASAGRTAPTLMASELEVLYGRTIGSGASAISRAPRDTRALEAAARGKGVMWLREDVVPRAPGDPRFTRAMGALQGDMWVRIGATMSAVLADLGVARGDRILLLMSGAATPLPLWLARDPANGRLLIDSYEIVTAPSLQALASAAQRDRRGGPDLVEGVFSPLGDLPGAEAEGALLERILGARLRRFDPASTRLSRSAGPIWHFATHAVADLAQSERSFIVVGPGSATHGGRLSAANVGALEPAAKPRLVFMAACESGLSQIGDRPDEFVGLPMAFLSAGASGVIGSLWLVSDTPATFISVQFYENWKRGMSPPAALRAAQLWVRDARRADLEAVIARLAIAGDPRLAPLTAEIAQLDPATQPYRDPTYWGGYYYAGL